MKKVYSDILFPVATAPVSKGMVVVDDNGKILEVLKEGDSGYEQSEAEYYPGWLIPGFMNAHCHLELSHLNGKIPQGTGLDGFLETLMLQREAAPGERLAAMQAADRAMYESGIVFCGDISNGDSSFAIKEDSDVLYHTFIERFGFHENKADAAMEVGYETLEKLMGLRRNNRGNLSLHAPYSVSQNLLARVCRELLQSKGILSIHNQETAAERDLFVHGNGSMAERLKRMGISDPAWSPPGISSLQWLSMQIPEQIRLLLVHNTYTEAADLAHWEDRDVWLCLCPGANQFIERRIPDVALFQHMKFRMVIGTDSLASNLQLDIWEELKLLTTHFPEIPLSDLLEWATLNGARLFGMDHQLGSIESGKAPGLVWIAYADPEGKKILPESKARRI